MEDHLPPAVKFEEYASKIQSQSGRTDPYTTVSLEAPDNSYPLGMREIVIAGSPNQNLIYRSIRALLGKHGVNAEVRLSKIPFRNW